MITSVFVCVCEVKRDSVSERVIIEGRETVVENNEYTHTSQIALAFNQDVRIDKDKDEFEKEKED